MNNNIKFSIIIPHFNIPELLIRCVNSIPDRDEIQVIIVDDNSPKADEYKNKYQELNRKNTELYLTKEGRGAGFVRNEGLKHAVGKWVLFADADDFFVEGFMDIINQYYDNDADVIYFNVKSVMSDNVLKPAHRNKDKLFHAYEKTKDITPFRYKYCEPWGKMFRLNFIMYNKIKFDETKVSNDFYFSAVSGCLAKKIIAVNKPLYIVTLRENSLSFQYGDTIEKLLIRLNVAMRVQIFCAEHGYVINPMPTRGVMVLLLKRNPRIFFNELLHLKKNGISITQLLYQMFNPRFMN